VLFMLDEVVTGFRLAWGGGQEFFDLQPDLVSYGKIIGGGTAIGAVGGRRELMRVFIASKKLQQKAGFEPLRPIFSGGTFSGNPLSMAAGHAQLAYLKEHADEVYPYVNEQSDRFAREVNAYCTSEELPARLLNAGSMLHLHFAQGPIETSRDLDGSLRKMEREFYLHLLYHGVVIPGLHVAFMSAAHTPEDVDFMIDAFKKSFDAVKHMADA